ncbi:ATP-binding protein [Mucilaginibacter rubeus]|nr:ATP-binding protein [Mucilaginibacter rubeus]QTE41599.1 CBS domain-containing protein [Mucilaginibacter rubeus]QTE48204.1 CBS domain-containing protein [Mucilaginibacter rubeus]QTE59593.1 CBS domain-containing protein [Mucilaginibacter rubeus]QTE60944.1 CBS domain-containing protein [Mucilaginibacter rubeus]QTF59708.1 CBS domain-containing protein [Mucilaginibacter rubeus]
MKINDLVNRTFSTASVLEDISHISKLLNDREYVAIINEDLTIKGIVTLRDLHSNPDCITIIDCDFSKPKVNPDQSIFEVFNQMKEAKTDFLPVFENDKFIGVISLMSVTGELVKTIAETKLNYQRAVHDLRNPLFNIQGLIMLLNETPDVQEKMDFLSLCSLSCKHATDILEDLLLVEAYESKPLSLVQTEMNYFYNQCINEQKGLSLLKNIQIITDLSTEPIIRNIDRSHFKRAVQNVIGNAVKFSYPDSIIKISSKFVENQLVLKIVDAGIGIPEHLQPEVFNKFSKAQRPGTQGEASTGLGLCFSKQCIEQHNGSIFFKSTEGKGTKFYISL